MVTIAIIGVLAGVVLITIDPAKQIQRASDAGKKSDISQIAGALEAYGVSHNAVYIIGATGSLSGGVEGAASAGTWDSTLVTSGEIKNVRDQAVVYDSTATGLTFRVYRALAATQLAWEEGSNDQTAGGATTTCNAAYPGGSAAVYYVYDTTAGKPYWHCHASGTAPTPL